MDQQSLLTGMVGALMKKNEGNKFFAQKELEKALKSYKESLKCLENEEKKQQNEQQQQTEQQFVCLIKNNIAAVLTELYRYKEVIEITTEIIEEFPTSLKAIFRRGVAYLQTHQILKANEDLKQALSLSPGNPEILSVIETANKRLQDPEYLREAIIRGDMKFQINDPYINDPLQQTQQKFQEPHKNDKKFQLEGARDFNLKEAKKHRVHTPKSIDLLKKSCDMDSWAYIDQQVADEYGFQKLDKDYWHLLLGIYEVMFLYLRINKESLEKAMEANKLDEFFAERFDKEGWFTFEGRKIQCLYYKHFLSEGLSAND